MIKGSGLAANTASIGTLTLNSSATYNTLFGPSTPSNGTATVSQYDRTGQKVAGTFTFTAGAVNGTGAAGSQNVTNGSFSFTQFRWVRQKPRIFGRVTHLADRMQRLKCKKAPLP